MWRQATGAVKRPLLVSHSGAPGGSNQVVLDLIEHGPRECVPACVLLGPGEMEEALAARDVPGVVIPTGRTRHVHRIAPAIQALRRTIRAHRADVVFAHTTKAHLYAAAAATLEGVPYLWWQHTVPGRQRLLDAFADRLPAAMIICSSRFTAQMQSVRTPRTPVRVVHPGTTAPVVVHPPCRRRDYRVGIACRMQRWKRVELLLHAVPRVLAAEPATNFVAMGGDEPDFDAGYRGELEAIARRLGVLDAIAFTGHVTNAPERIGDLDLLVHTADQEPFGLIYLEALARGVAVVAPVSGGSSEIIRDEIDGRLIDVMDAVALAETIIALLRDVGRRQAMGIAGRARVLEHFTAARMAQEAWSIARHTADQA